MRRPTKLETFEGRNGRFYYRFRAGNGEVVALCRQTGGVREAVDRSARGRPVRRGAGVRGGGRRQVSEPGDDRRYCVVLTKNGTLEGEVPVEALGMLGEADAYSWLRLDNPKGEGSFVMVRVGDVIRISVQAGPNAPAVLLRAEIRDDEIHVLRGPRLDTGGIAAIRKALDQYERGGV